MVRHGLFSLKSHNSGNSGKKIPAKKNPAYTNVVIIDDDEEPKEEKAEENDDDCQVTGSWFPSKKRVEAQKPSSWRSRTRSSENGIHRHSRKYESAAATENGKHKFTTRRASLSEDSEVSLGVENDIRREWEEAAKRKKKGNSAKLGDRQFSAKAASSSKDYSSIKVEGKQSASSSKDQLNALADCFGEADIKLEKDDTSKINFQPSSSVSPQQNIDETKPLDEPEPEDADLIAEREKLKESDQFRKADEEEWQRRQEELQKQALETQRLKKRKRAEAERQLAMEKRQKQRLEQIRENQIQEVKKSGLKDIIRGQIQTELQLKVAGCSDMATLLRRLDIPVEGGTLCTQEQVNAAYKKALLRYHPDRAGNNDTRLQVEAEETFKLVTRMKKSLPSVKLRVR